jgi:hypothetical protein
MNEEMLDLLTRVYSITSRRLLAEALGIKDISPEAILEQWGSEEHAEKYKNLGDLENLILSHINKAGGQVRGENLRRDLVLEGHGDLTSTLRGMITGGLLIVLPNVGEMDFELDQVLDATTILQRELLLPEGLSELFDELENTMGLEGAELEVEDLVPASASMLELNLLHVSTSLLYIPLKLNKSGAPNKRNVQKVGRGLVLPGQKQELADTFDPSVAHQIDYLGFIIGLGVELDLVHVDEEYARGNMAGMKAFFESPIEKRNRQLNEAFCSLKTWSEVDSVELDTPDDEIHLSLTATSGKKFIAARGYVLSILRRAQTAGWIRIKDVEELCQRLDARFMAETLKSSGADPSDFINALLNRGLHWLGVMDHAESGGDEVVRLTPRGRRILGIDSSTEEPQPKGMGLVVQPNLEIMAFLDGVTLSTLFTIYRVGKRRSLADRVAIFQLTSGSTQRGYAGGLTAEMVKELLTQGHIPLPESVAFQLDDWERLHRRITLYTKGFVVRHPDPDTLDMSIGQVKHDDGAEVVRLGPYSAFVTELSANSLRRLTERGEGIILDYLGELPPCIEFAGPLHVRVLHALSDVLTLYELSLISKPVEQPKAGYREFELDAEKIQKRWPETPLKSAIHFFESRSVNGLPPEQKILLLSAIHGAPGARFMEKVTVVSFDDEEVADAFADLTSSNKAVEMRLGPKAFLVDASKREEIAERLKELGVEL